MAKVGMETFDPASNPTMQRESAKSANYMVAEFAG